jgi:hypothetical protein
MTEMWKRHQSGLRTRKRSILKGTHHVPVWGLRIQPTSTKGHRAAHTSDIISKQLCWAPGILENFCFSCTPKSRCPCVAERLRWDCLKSSDAGNVHASRMLRGQLSCRQIQDRNMCSIRDCFPLCGACNQAREDQHLSHPQQSSLTSTHAELPV